MKFLIFINIEYSYRYACNTIFTIYDRQHMITICTDSASMRSLYRILLSIIFLCSNIVESRALTRKTCDPNFKIHKQDLAHAAIRNISLSSDSIITGTEYEELKLDWLLHLLDRAQTSFGGEMLKQLLIPIADRAEIERRQSITKIFLKNESLCTVAYDSLNKLYQHEAAILSYVTQSDLEKHAATLYYDIVKISLMEKVPGLKRLETTLNNSRLALEAALWFDLSKAGLTFARQLCLEGLYTEFVGYSLGYRKEFDIARGLKNGLKEPLQQIGWWHEICNQNWYDPENQQHVGNAILSGTWRDRFEAFRNGATQVDRIVFNGRTITEIAQDMKQAVMNYFGKKVVSNPIDSLMPKLAKDSSMIMRCSMNASAALASTGISMWYFLRTSMNISDAWKRVVFLYAIMNNLQERLVSVAAFFKELKHFADIVARNGDAVHELVQPIHDLFNNNDKELTELFTLLQSNTFSTQCNLFYRRGNVLRAHTLVKKLFERLQPALQALAALDAHYAIAMLCKESENNVKRFQLATFVESEEPCIIFKDCWIPVLREQSVFNDVIFNAENEPGKRIITGPNGGGKSTYLKMIGQSVVLAQSWGIVPATSNQLTLFTGLRTCLHPQEDLQQGLSTFMAERACMDEITSFAHKAQGPILLLIDEPYRGTVDLEASKRIYTFGKSIADMKYCIASIATHNQYPVELAHDTNGAFANWHVHIEETRSSFKRTYKIKPGPADWWFENEEKRSSFIDWLAEGVRARKKQTR